MKFDFFRNVTATAVQMTNELFVEATTCTPERMQLYKAIAQCTDDDQRQRLKKQLSAVTWQAHFPNGRRKNAEAVPSGLFIIDIDHIDNPDEVASSLKPLIHDCHIVVMHKTPSTKGVRIVAECQRGLSSIQENQADLAKHITDRLPELKDKIDTCVKDLARLSYIVPFEYFYFFDGSIWTREADPSVCFLTGLPSENEAPSDSQSSETPSEDPSEMQDSFDGFPLEAIANKWLELRGGLPQKGERNSVLYTLASRLRYITDFTPAVIARHIPHCDLSESEISGICRNACSAPRAAAFPTDLRLALSALKRADATDDEDEPDDSYLDFVSQLPPMPIGLRDSLSGLPDKVKMPVLCGLLPLAMTYATDVTVRYADGEIQRLNLMTVIYGEQASGKSCVKRVVDIWKKPMQEADRLSRREEDKFKELKRNRAANEKLPPEPKRIIREVPITVSCSTLLKRMKNSEGKHIFSFGEELDTLRKTNSAGSWSQKYDIYRLSFDNGEWGQDYNSDNAESGVVRLAYNFTILGTLGAVMRTFKNDSTENGMCGRVLFAKMPSQPYAHMPKYGKGMNLSDTYLQEENIRKAVDILQKYEGFVDTPQLSEAICKWCDDKADEARLNKDKIVDTFRKRAAVIAFRGGATYQLLENGESDQEEYFESQNSIDFALLLAEYALQNQSDLFGEQLLSSNVQIPSHITSKRLLDKLPIVFTFEMLQEANPGRPYQSLRNDICRWKKDKLIVSKDRNLWEKL